MVSRTRGRTCHDSAAALAGKSERGRNSTDQIGQVIGGLRTLGPDDGDLRPFGIEINRTAHPPVSCCKVTMHTSVTRRAETSSMGECLFW